MSGQFLLSPCSIEIPVINANSIDPDSNVFKISPPKTECFQIKILTFFIFLLKTLIVPREGGSNEYPQSVLSRNKKSDIYPCKPHFY